MEVISLYELCSQKILKRIFPSNKIEALNVPKEVTESLEAYYQKLKLDEAIKFVHKEIESVIKFDDAYDEQARYIDRLALPVAFLKADLNRELSCTKVGLKLATKRWKAKLVKEGIPYYHLQNYKFWNKDEEGKLKEIDRILMHDVLPLVINLKQTVLEDLKRIKTKTVVLE